RRERDTGELGRERQVQDGRLVGARAPQLAIGDQRRAGGGAVGTEDDAALGGRSAVADLGGLGSDGDAGGVERALALADGFAARLGAALERDFRLFYHLLRVCTAVTAPARTSAGGKREDDA